MSQQPSDCASSDFLMPYSVLNCIVLLYCAGLSPDLQSMEQIRRIMRPTDVPDTG